MPCRPSPPALPARRCPTASAGSSASPPGGGPDLLTRLLVQRLEPELGRTIVVENRPGAAGNLAATAIARARPDGATFGTLFAANLAVNRHLYPSLGYDPAR